MSDYRYIMDRCLVFYMEDILHLGRPLSVIGWFKTIPKKTSITEDILDQAILWAKFFVDIPDEHMDHKGRTKIAFI